ncbi:hypothetical protein [Streptomyces sp. MJP52]|uniref:hypothetical protein n=1 Tax=Streptomyces sp. MJP52 TaxID=2940555 RepID=UPI002476D0FF|nr:hypothetical protein [Streptomyces sp. MJP52]MDH6229400.1 hypothetical protein [Streptomyces sp. MJP52]
MLLTIAATHQRLLARLQGIKTGSEVSEPMSEDRGGKMSDKKKLVAFVIAGFVVSVIVLVYGLQTGEVVPLALAALGFPSASVLTFLMIRHSRRSL